MLILPGIGGSFGSTTASHQRGPRMCQRLAQHRSRLFGSSMRESRGAAARANTGEIDRLQLDAELRVALEHHLLPLDHPEHVVLDDDDLHVAACI